MYTPCSKCHCSSGDSKIKFFFATLTDWSRSTKSPCARFLWQVAVSLRTCAARSGEVDQCDCRHECDDEEESNQEDVVESDHVHDDHDDNCSASGF